MQKYKAYHEAFGWAHSDKIVMLGDGSGYVDYTNSRVSLTNPRLHLKRVCQKTDRFGHEVWEGAVLKFDVPEAIYYVIEWDGGWQIRWDTKTAKIRRQKTLGYIPGNISDIMELLGDCHENPELMKPFEPIKETPDA